jgi:hypothetical protein
MSALINRDIFPKSRKNVGKIPDILYMSLSMFGKVNRL